MNIVFVILHYLAEKDTIECIESIEKNVIYNNKKIIVIDNASTNESFKNIKKKYLNNKNIILIENEKNLGFARGNNVGFRYAKEKLQADFIVMLNNDTIVYQNDFVNIIIEKYKEKKFYILGPDIQTKDGYHQNPMKNRNWTEFKLVIFKIKAIIRILDLKLFAIETHILKHQKKINELKSELQGDRENIRLHGACLIFSPDYINKFDGLNEGTFLYMEEDLLKIEMDYFNLPMLYTSELKIIHKEDVSTNMMDGTNREKDIRFLKNLINSIDVCIKRVHELKIEKRRNKI